MVRLQSNQGARTWVARAAVGLGLGTLLLLYAPPTPAGLIVVSCAAGVVAIFLLPQNGLLLLGSMLFITAMIEVSLRFAVTEALTPYYRPHEMLASGVRYRPSQSVTMAVPHGDLLAIDPKLNRALAVPRTEVFRTDALGYRNDKDFAEQRLLLVGDSFVAGNGSSQEDTITSKLLTEFGVHSYNLGFQAGPHGYAERIAWARNHFSDDACLALIMFEGNDFQLVDGAEAAMRTEVPQMLQRAVKRYVNAVRKPFYVSRVTYGLITRASAVRQAGDEEPTFVRDVGGKPMIFLRGYAEVTARERYDDHGFIQAQLERARPDVIFFVPDKYRVYALLLDDQPSSELPDAQWQHLERVAHELGIPAFNLTERLRARSTELLASGLTTYWRDDTHWNGEGTAAGAAVVVDALSKSATARCRAPVDDPNAAVETTALGRDGA